jgi:esterase/lipase superfamily enzyme
METAALFSTEVQFPVISIAYSWPSAGTYIGYWHDEDMVRASSLRFRAFLQALLTKSPAEVVIVCHSMGVREVTSSLAELGRSGVQLQALHKVIFAAADISKEEFGEAWPDMKKLSGVQFGFYASSHDVAMTLSHVVHGLDRLGDASPPVMAPAGGTTVDATNVDPIYQEAGHSYILKSPRIGTDVGMWVDSDMSPAARGLTQVVRFGQTYYLIP